MMLLIKSKATRTTTTTILLFIIGLLLPQDVVHAFSFGVHNNNNNNNRQAQLTAPTSRITSTRTSNKKHSLYASVAVPNWQEQQEEEEESLENDETTAWVKKLDFDAFQKDVNALGKELQKETPGEDIVKHLNKIVSWNNAAMIAGILTMALPPNPFTIVALSTWTYASWTMIGHHTCHGGYNRIGGGAAAKKYKSRGFAVGSIQKRVMDWCDWMLPEAWNVEHNRLHHYHLGETKDPDLVERNAGFLRSLDLPMFAKYLGVGLLMPVWKWFYYAPNTYKELKITQAKAQGKELPNDFDPLSGVTLVTLLFPKTNKEQSLKELFTAGEFFSRVLMPFFVTRFILLPAPLLFLPTLLPQLFTAPYSGVLMAKHALVNLLCAELLTNIHGFVTIVTNHAGDDIYSFSNDEIKPRSGAFYVRQIVGSTNFDAGHDAIDFSHGFLNYQIEHHVWPDMSMLQYQKAAPKLRALCNKHGVPYVQENVFVRLLKTANVMVGKTNMRPFPTHLEPSSHKAGVTGVTWKNTHGAIDDE